MQMRRAAFSTMRTMSESTITILGEEIKIGFNMAVEIAYEEIAGKAFDLKELNSQKNSMALYMAAIITFNPNTKLTFDDIIMKATAAEISALGKAVVDAMEEWMKVPEVIPADEQKPDEEPKN